MNRLALLTVMLLAVPSLLKAQSFGLYSGSDPDYELYCDPSNCYDAETNVTSGSAIVDIDGWCFTWAPPILASGSVQPWVLWRTVVSQSTWQATEPPTIQTIMSRATPTPGDIPQEKRCGMDMNLPHATTTILSQNMTLLLAVSDSSITARV
jgi:hypothetical protein